MLGLLRKRASAITFDPGLSAIRVCQLRGGGQSGSVRDRIELALPGADAKSRMPDMPRLCRAIEQGDFSGADVGLVLGSPLARFHALKLPEPLLREAPEQASEALAWEIARETRADPAQLEVRFWKLPPGHRQGLNVLAATIPRDAAIQLFGDFSARRLRLRSVGVAPCALVRAALLLHDPGPEEVWGVLDLGGTHTSLTIVLQQTPVYVRSLAFQSDHLTRRISEAFEVPPEEAEAIKRRHGLTPSDRGLRPGRGASLVSDEDIARVVFAVAREPLEALTRDIIQCFSYVIESFPAAQASRLFLAGGGAALNGLESLLEDLLGVPTEVLRRAAGADGGSHIELTPSCAAVVGAALLDVEAA